MNCVVELVADEITNYKLQITNRDHMSTERP